MPGYLIKSYKIEVYSLLMSILNHTLLKLMLLLESTGDGWTLICLASDFYEHSSITGFREKGV